MRVLLLAGALLALPATAFAQTEYYRWAEEENVVLDLGRWEFPAFTLYVVGESPETSAAIRGYAAGRIAECCRTPMSTEVEYQAWRRIYARWRLAKAIDEFKQLVSPAVVDEILERNGIVHDVPEPE